MNFFEKFARTSACFLSQEPSCNRLEKLVQMNFFVWVDFGVEFPPVGVREHWTSPKSGGRELWAKVRRECVTMREPWAASTWELVRYDTCLPLPWYNTLQACRCDPTKEDLQLNWWIFEVSFALAHTAVPWQIVSNECHKALHCQGRNRDKLSECKGSWPSGKQCPSAPSSRSRNRQWGFLCQKAFPDHFCNEN